MFKQTLTVLASVVMSFSLINCKQAEENNANPLDGLVQLSGEFSSGGQQKLGGLSLSQYTFYCVTFTSPSEAAQSEIDSTGYFSLYLPKSVPFGCFINETATSTPVASIVVEASGSGFQSGSSNVLALSNNLHIPNLNLDLDTGKVAVPQTSIAPVLADVPPGFEIEDVHDGAYQMSCVATGNSIMDTECQEFITEENSQNDSVYLRVMRATDNVTGEAVRGLGVWKDQNSFNNCGGIDMLGSMVADIEADDNITFDAQGVLSGSAFVNDQQLCPGRDGQAVLDYEDVKNYYALGKLIEVAGTYTLHVEDEWNDNQGCIRHEMTNVTFEGSSAQSLTGNFHGSTHYVELSPGACNGKTDKESAFLVEFTKLN